MMSKSVLVTDTPRACIDCPCHFTYDDGEVRCGAEDKELETDDIESFRPDWCPLQEDVSMSEKLKKCPFCGGEAYFKTMSSGYLKDNRSFEFNIECKECRASVPAAYKVVLTLDKNGELKCPIDERDDAIAAWNRRCV